MPDGTPPRSLRRPERWGHGATRGVPYKPRFLGTVAVTSPQSQISQIAAQSHFAFLPLVARHELLLFPPPMAPEWEKRVVRKMKQTAEKKKTAAGPARAAPPPSPRVTQALFRSEERRVGKECLL